MSRWDVPVGLEPRKGHAMIFFDISNSKDRNINLAKILQKLQNFSTFGKHGVYYVS